jgi:hypothetical protein
MLTVAATIPDAAARDQFADRLAHKAKVTEGVIRDEIRKAAAQKKTEAPAIAAAPLAPMRPAEQGLLWALMHRPVEALAAIGPLDAADLAFGAAGSILALASSLADVPPDVLPKLLRERLSDQERALFDRAAAADAAAAPAVACARALQRERSKRDLAAVQDEIDRLDTRAAGTTAALQALWSRKKTLLTTLEALTSEDV